jgi:predicted membrane metal-binding protein
MNEKVYNIEVRTPLRKVKTRRLAAIDFLLSGIAINFFEEKRSVIGKFAQIENKLREATKEQNEAELSPEQTAFIEHVLKEAVQDYDNLEIFDAEKIYIFQQVIHASCIKFSDMVKPDYNMTVNCHYLAKNYGGDPWQYLDMPIDRFIFNLFCLNSGVAHESAAIKKAQAKANGGIRSKSRRA